MARETFANHYNRELLDDAYLRWSRDPESVDSGWQAFFAGADFNGKIGGTATAGPTMNVETRLQTGAVRLITAYRDLGHLAAHLDPLNPAPNKEPWLISLERFKLSAADLDSEVDASMYFGIDGPMKLRDVLETLKETYSPPSASSTCTFRTSRPARGSRSAWSRGRISRFSRHARRSAR